MRFTLPHAKIIEGGWRLRSNEPRSLTIKPLIMSPGTTAENRRFGDVRLQCRVFWEFQDNASGPLRILGDMIGVCTSSRVNIQFVGEKPLQSVTLSEHGKADVALELTADKSRFRIPLSDNSISNDASIRFMYQ